MSQIKEIQKRNLTGKSKVASFCSHGLQREGYCTIKFSKKECKCNGCNEWHELLHQVTKYANYYMCYNCYNKFKKDMTSGY